MNCQYCGAQLAADARFCAQCGNPVGTLGFGPSTPPASASPTSASPTPASAPPAPPAPAAPVSGYPDYLTTPPAATGYPEYPAAPPPAPRRNHVPVIIASVVAVVLILGFVGATALFLAHRSSSTPVAAPGSTSGSTSGSTTPAPTGSTTPGGGGAAASPAPSTSVKSALAQCIIGDWTVTQESHQFTNSDRTVDSYQITGGHVRFDNAVAFQTYDADATITEDGQTGSAAAAGVVGGSSPYTVVGSTITYSSPDWVTDNATCSGNTLTLSGTADGDSSTTWSSTTWSITATRDTSGGSSV